MPLFLSPYVGAGTKADPFRPQGLLEPGASAVDIRLDPTRADGDGIGFALLWSPAGIPDPAGAIKLAEDYGEPITDRLRNLVNARTGLDFSLDTTIQEVIQTIMLRPDTIRWKRLRAFKGRLELWLGSSTGKRKWIDALVMAGGSITDDFNRADETVLKYPWTRQGLSVIKATLVSNAIRGTASSGQGMYYHNRSIGGWHADQSSSFRYASAMTSDDWGPTVRNADTGLSCYSFEQWSGGRSIAKYVNGSASTIETVTGSASTGVVYKIDVSGSTIRYYEDGVEHAGSPATDTSLATGGFGPGVIFYRNDGGVDDFVGTGEQTPSSTIIYLGSASDSQANGADATVSLADLSLQENDLVVLGGAIGDNDNIDFTMALVGATGWNKEADLFADDTQDVSLGVWTKIMGATPDSSVVVSGQGGTDSTTVAVAHAFRGVDLTTPMDVAVTPATGLNTAHADPPSIDHNNPSGVATVVVVASGNTGGGSQFVHTPPTNYGLTWETTFANDTSDASIGMGVNFSPADPENPGTANYTGTDSTSFCWAAVTMALRPAVAATFNVGWASGATRMILSGSV